MSPFSPAPRFSPPSGPATGAFNGPHLKSKFLAFSFASSFALVVALVLTADVAGAQTFPALTPSDIPRSTQAGTLPAGASYKPPVPPSNTLPNLWLIGDSTVRNGSAGDGSILNEWGWGAPIVAYFDLTKINVINRALGGTSSRTFYTGNWPAMVGLIKPGDFVILQFGANDNGGASGKGALSGIGEDTQLNGSEVVHSFGWYLRQYVTETRARGGNVIICSLTPRKSWTADGHFTRANTTHAAWAAQVAQQAATPFVDLYELIARKYEAAGKTQVDLYYVPSPTETLHTGWDGAVVNAECVVSGLNALQTNPLAAFRSARGQAVAAVDVLIPPVLTLARYGSQVTLEWPVWSTGYNLRSSADLAPGSWTAMTNTTTDSGTTRSVSLTVSGSKQFYRLSKP